MNCLEARRHWELYLDSEGTPELHLEIRLHLGSCAACASWFGQQQWLEREIKRSLVAGDLTPELWVRALATSGIRPQARRRLPLLIGAGAAAAIALVAVVLSLRSRADAHVAELAREAADWHARWQAGQVHPDVVSRSHEEIEDFLRARQALPWRCPPAQPGGFQVLGAGLRLAGGQQAPYIVGLLGDADVSILILDRTGLLEDHDTAAYRQGHHQVVVGSVGAKVALITGTSSAEELRRLLDQFRRLALAPDDFPRI